MLSTGQPRWYDFQEILFYFYGRFPMGVVSRWARWGSFPAGPAGVHFPMGPMARWDSLFELVVEIDANVAR